MGLMIVTGRVRPDAVARLEEAAAKMFAAINAHQPPGVRYASCKIAGSTTFVAILELEAEDGQNPLMAIPEFAEFQQFLPTCLAEEPTLQPATVVGSYRLFGSW
jgi:hypothetical protein